MPGGLVTVKTYPLPAAAEAARMHLASEGIDAHLADAETVNMDWLLGNALGYVKLQVAVDQAERAAALLEQARPESGEGQPSDDNTCLSCGAPFPARKSACPSCGWSFSDAGDDEPSREEDAEAAGPAGGPSPTEVLSGLKKPVLLIFFWPVLVGGLVLVAGLLALALGLIGRAVR